MKEVYNLQMKSIIVCILNMMQTREYLKFYNESEIKRDNFKTINDYLIKKYSILNTMKVIRNFLQVKDIKFRLEDFQMTFLLI